MSRQVARAALGILLFGAAALAHSATPAVSAGGGHGVALKADGSVRAWGSDGEGQLGLGRPLGLTPIAVQGLSGVKALSVGFAHTVALKGDGSVWAWGDNGRGQLGDGTTEARTSPVRVVGLSGVIAVSAGESHTVALKGDHTVWAWGYNLLGQLGDGTAGFLRTAPVQVAGLRGVVGISVGGDHINPYTVALKADGSVWMWGPYACRSGVPQPCRVNGLAGVVAISAGREHALALKADGTVWGWGNNWQGQLGNGTYDIPLDPVQATGLSGVVAISAGWGHSVALKGDGSVWTWGRNYSGELGDGAATEIGRTAPAVVSGLTGVTAVATSAQSRYTTALKGDGSIWAWGENSDGQLGDGTRAFSRPVPTQVSGLTGASAVATGASHTAAVRADGSVWAWGREYLLGHGLPLHQASPVTVTGLTGVTALSAGVAHTVALKADGTAWAWGRNNFGQLGDGSDVLNRSVPVPVSVTGLIAVSARGHTLGLKADGTVWSWGTYVFAVPGTGPPANSPLPSQVPGVTGAIAISAGGFHSVALKGDGTVWAWGNNSVGELGDGTTNPRESAVQVSGLANVVAVSAASNRAVALKGDGSVWAWPSATQLTPAQVAGSTGVVAISASDTHTVALKGDGSVWAWGENSFGQLGDGTTVGRALPVQVVGLAGVVAVSAGGTYTLALKGDGTVWAWGAGGLGDGTYVSRTHPVVVLAEGGAGSLDTNDWFLHLDPSKPVVIPAANVPTALANARIGGAGGLDATMKYRSAEFGSSVNNYVFGLVPPQFFSQVKLAPGSATEKELRDKLAGTLVLAQLTPAGWTNVQGQLIAYSQGVASAAGGAASILDRFDPASIPGARFCIGYGQTADAMLGSEALLEVLAVEGSSASASGVPCVLAGVYMGGPAASLQGTPVTFRASVVGLSPTGTVQFRDGPDAFLAPASLAGSNAAVATASVTTSSLASGTHSIGAAYSGDAQNAAATAEVPLRHDVSSPPGGTRAELSGPASSAQGGEVAFTVVVTGNAPGGSVEFRNAGASLGAAVPLVQATATIRIANLALGAHSITAVYSGDAANAASASNAIAHTVYAALTTGVALASSANPSAHGAPVTLTATVSGIDPTGFVTFRDGGAEMSTTELVNGKGSVTFAALAAGIHVITADYGGDARNQVASAVPHIQRVMSQRPASGPVAFAFAPANNAPPGGIVTSNAIVVSGLDAAVPISVTGGTYSIGCAATFTAAAGMIGDGQSVCVRHIATGGFGAMTVTTLTIGSVSSSFTSTTHSASFPGAVTALVTHYYQSILRRAPDAGGQAYWESEARRASALGTNATEAFYAMGMSFFASAEYTALNRDNAGFVTDLYNAFLHRPPDAAGSGFWAAQLSAGMPREVLLVSFMFSEEFVAFTRGALGSGEARAEVDALTDFYRGLLARLPDDGGFLHWLGRFRTAQCQGPAAVTALAEDISRIFVESSEYAVRGRTTAQYVGDLYNAFLRRGGDLQGVQFWINRIANGALSRDAVRVQFRSSPEFQARVAAIIAQGCL